MISASAIWLSARTCGRSCAAPNEQLSPTVSGLAWRTAHQNASMAWPDRLRPDRSVSVIESMIGTSRPSSPSSCLTAMIAALASVRQQHPSRLVCAVPVASAEALAAIRPLADDVVCLLVPEDFEGVGQFYRDFQQVEDEDVLACLRSAAGPQTVH